MSTTQIRNTVGFDGLSNSGEKLEGLDDFLDGQDVLIGNGSNKGVL